MIGIGQMKFSYSQAQKRAALKEKALGLLGYHLCYMNFQECSLPFSNAYNLHIYGKICIYNKSLTTCKIIHFLTRNIDTIIQDLNTFFLKKGMPLLFQAH